MSSLCRLTVLGFAFLFISCAKTKPNFNEVLVLDWQFSEAGRNTWYAAEVPGSVQEDLLRHNLILDPFVGTNEDSIQWVEGKNWTYKSTLLITEEMMRYDHLNLCFNGLDTYARVYLNDSLLINAKNMFIAYTADIRGFARRGNNDLRVEFTSPIKQNTVIQDSLPYELPSTEAARPKVRPLVRKAAYQFGWDFAPRIVTMGIWRQVEIEAWDAHRIQMVHYIPRKITDSLAVYEAEVRIESSIPGNCQLVINDTIYLISLEKGINVINQPIEIRKPILWWPNGLGEQHLYDFMVSIAKNGLVLDADTTKIGIRTIDLVQEGDDFGTSFRFLINGQTVFMKGANWSPISSYPGSVPDSVYRQRLTQVKEANMNMLRVWGGGFYESDLFYELCDKYGILIWQDFMFANTMYPPTTDFYRNVEKEVRFQVSRLQNHPSIALWNGNNEIEVAWRNWSWQDQYGYSETDSAELWQFYLAIFDKLIPNILNEANGQFNYCQTSPLSNWGRPENFNHGSMHYWGVWHGQDGLRDYRNQVGRFVSEYGFQSFPDSEATFSYTDVRTASPDYDKQLHQKSYVGTNRILQEVRDWFGEPEGFADFISKSQQTQALGYKLAIEAHRLADKCDGTLFWQLNDCWPGPSWSVVDYKGQPKLAYEVVKDRYKPTIIVPLLRENDIEIFVLNEDMAITTAEVRLALLNESGKLIWSFAKPIALNGDDKALVYRSHKSKVLDGHSADEATLKISLLSSDKIIDIEYLYFTTPKYYRGDVDLIGLK